VGVWALGLLPGGALPDRADLRAVMRVGQQAAVLLDYARLSAEQVRQAVLAQDLARARQIQRRLLPHEVAGWPGQLEIAARLQPARETSGDFYDIFPLWDEQSGPGNGSALVPLQVAVGDVQGKGLGAALVMALAQATLRSTANQAGAAPSVPDGSAVAAGGDREPSGESHEGAPLPATLASGVAAPAATLRLAGGLLHRTVGSRDFVCCALAVVEPAQHGQLGPRLWLANAAQVPPLLCRGGQVMELQTLGEHLPLGVLPAPRYEQAAVELAPGDVVVCSTDGIAEAPAAVAAPALETASARSTAEGDEAPLLPAERRGELFGFERLAQSVSFWAQHARGAQAVLDGIWADVTAWCGEDSSHDDMTLVVLHVPR
jgi:serine phosphatase RsbU (regulator of sigma subunit)